MLMRRSKSQRAPKRIWKIKFVHQAMEKISLARNDSKFWENPQSKGVILLWLILHQV